MAFSGNSSEFPYRGGIFNLQGGIVLFTGRYLLIAPLNILTCDFKTRRERALKAAILGQYECYRRVDFSFLYCHTSHTLLMSRWKIYLWTSILRLGESSLELLRQAWIPKTTGNSRESMGIPGNLGNSQGHFTKPGIPLHYLEQQVLKYVQIPYVFEQEVPRRWWRLTFSFCCPADLTIVAEEDYAAVHWAFRAIKVGALVIFKHRNITFPHILIIGFHLLR